ncbi:Ribosomal protein L11 methyltransferase [bioreactor metagenome]|uniref:Ribosomal protein L11 methyltransferase n=1 Tax=bioreactor metagenome TaxID=1076179 RepID=A0A645AXR8_9ZZZZ
MKWAEISIQTSHEATEAVANIFHELGSSGVVIEDPELVNSYRRSGIWDYTDIPEFTDTETVTVKAYLPADDQLDEKLRLFKRLFDELAVHNLDRGSGVLNCHEVNEEDWSSSWKEFFHPVKIGERIVIKPSWEDYLPEENDLVIELDPGMAFGTGTHHTTAMCCRCLEDVIRPGVTVFDIGTGSGILSIAAAKLGADAVEAVDLDSVAVRVARENVALNDVKDIVKVAQGDLLTGITGKADVVIANIIADIIIKMAPDIPDYLNDDGYFIASGIISERLGDVSSAIVEQNLVIEKVLEEGGWVALVVSKGEH